MVLQIFSKVTLGYKWQKYYIIMIRNSYNLGRYRENRNTISSLPILSYKFFLFKSPLWDQWCPTVARRRETN